jgi:hypothetical protein
MGLTSKEKRSATKVTAPGYQKATKKQKGIILEEFAALTDRLPFNLLGIDSDNGSEFINDQLYRYCGAEKITFTRARSYRKNDICFVEQKTTRWSEGPLVICGMILPKNCISLMSCTAI